MNQKKTTKIKFAATAAAAAMILLLGISGCTVKKAENSAPTPVQNSSEFLEGTSIGGKNISGKTTEEAIDIARKALDEKAKAIEISVKFKDDTVALKGDDFEIKDILELTMPKLLKSGKADKYEIAYVTDLSEKGKQKLSDAAKACYSTGKNATVSGFDTNNGTFVFADEKKGSRVDMVKTLASISQLLSQKHGGAIQAAFLETKPTLTKETLSKNFVLMSSYSTESGNTENGNANMRLALSHVNGTVLEPGQVFSYNSVIGDSTNPDAGWMPAGGIMGGILVQMYGGGICQGSTTLYNAVLKAGMQIVERDCHSMPSSYCPIGLDATVDYGNLDLKFSNPLDTPVYIAAWMDGVTLNVNVYGCFPAQWDRAEISSEQTGTVPPLSDISFTEDQSLANGEFVKKSSGNTGYYAKAYRTYYKGDTKVKTEELSDSYYEPTGVVYAVGPGTDTSKVDTKKDSGNTNATPTPKPTPTPTATPPVVTPPPEESSPEPTESPDSSVPEETPNPDESPMPPPSSGGIIDWS